MLVTGVAAPVYAAPGDFYDMDTSTHYGITTLTTETRALLEKAYSDGHKFAKELNGSKFLNYGAAEAKIIEAIVNHKPITEALAAIIADPACFATIDPDQYSDPGAEEQPAKLLSPLQSSTDTIFIGDQSPIVFRISVANLPAQATVKLVELDANNNPVQVLEVMRDDGNVQNGDDIPGDNVFSTAVPFDETQNGTMKVEAVVEGTESSMVSNELSLTIVEHVTDTQFEKAITLSDNTETKFNEIAQSQGEEEAQQQTVEWLQSQPEVKEVGVSESGEGIWYALDSGILGGALLNSEDSKGGRSTSKPIKPLVTQDVQYESGVKLIPGIKLTKSIDSIIGSKKILVVSPFADQGGGSQLPSTTYDTVMNTFQSHGYSSQRKLGSEATVELFKSIENYGVVVLDTHGEALYNKTLTAAMPALDSLFASSAAKVIFLTGEQATDVSKQMYEADLKKGRLLLLEVIMLLHQPSSHTIIHRCRIQLYTMEAAEACIITPWLMRFLTMEQNHTWGIQNMYQYHTIIK